MEIQGINFIDYFQYNAYVTLTFFFICLIVWALDKLTRGTLTKNIFSTEKSSLLNPLTYIRFFTHIFGHKDWQHLSNNFLKILLLGPLIEEKYGSINFLIMILITAFVTGVANYFKGNVRMKGASRNSLHVNSIKCICKCCRKQNTNNISFNNIILYYR